MSELPWETGPTYTQADAITAEKLADDKAPVDYATATNSDLVKQLEHVATIFDEGHRNHAAIAEAAKRLKPGKSIMLEIAAASREHDEMEVNWRDAMRKATGTEREVLTYMGEICGWPS